MTTLTELKQQADHLGLAPEMVRLYGDLRLKTTWEKALIANKTITVDAVEVSAVEIADTVADEIERAEIIPFIGEIDLAECNDRKSTMLLEVRQRAIFKKKQAIDCPPPPPPAPIIRPCPIPENPPSIPGIEIAEREESPPPGHGRGDERFRNLGDRLFEQIKSDILRYFEHQKEDVGYCLENDYLYDDQHKELINLIELMEWNIKNKPTIFDVWSTVPYFAREGFYKLIPFAIQHFFKNGIPPVDFWECDRHSHFLLLYRPTPIPTLSEKFGGVFIPSRLHELGEWHYLWKFPGAIQAENFLHEITDAKDFAVIPANKPITVNELVLVGV